MTLHDLCARFKVIDCRKNDEIQLSDDSDAMYSVESFAFGRPL